MSCCLAVEYEAMDMWRKKLLKEDGGSQKLNL